MSNVFGIHRMFCRWLTMEKISSQKLLALMQGAQARTGAASYVGLLVHNFRLRLVMELKTLRKK